MFSDFCVNQKLGHFDMKKHEHIFPIGSMRLVCVLTFAKQALLMYVRKYTDATWIILLMEEIMHQLRLVFIPVWPGFCTSKRWFFLAGILNHQQTVWVYGDCFIAAQWPSTFSLEVKSIDKSVPLHASGQARSSRWMEHDGTGELSL